MQTHTRIGIVHIFMHRYKLIINWYQWNWPYACCRPLQVPLANGHPVKFSPCSPQSYKVIESISVSTRIKCNQSFARMCLIAARWSQSLNISIAIQLQLAVRCVQRTRFQNVHARLLVRDAEKKKWNERTRLVQPISVPKKNPAEHQSLRRCESNTYAHNWN